MDLPAEFDDGIEYSNYAEYNSQDCSSDLTDSENDVEECGLTSTASLEHIVTPRCLKRRNDVFVDSSAVVPERRLRRRIHEQFELLRAIVPNLCTDEKASILTGANEYIEKLQRQEAELLCELGIESLDEEELSCCEDEVSSQCRESEERAAESEESGAGCSESSLSSGSNCGCSQQTVEVVRTEEGLRIHIECEKRPGLLLEIMELLESTGLMVEQASIECVECLVIDGIGLEVEGSEDSESSNITCVSAEVVGARLRTLIGGQRQENIQ